MRWQAVCRAIRAWALEHPQEAVTLSRVVATSIRALARIALPGVPLATAAQGVWAWTQITDPAVLFDHAILSMTKELGIRATRTIRS